MSSILFVGLDRAAGWGLVVCRGLDIFSHATALGNAPAHHLLKGPRLCAGQGASLRDPYRIMLSRSQRMISRPA